MTCPSHVKEQLTRGEEVEEESQTEREGGCHQSPVAIQGDSHSRRIGFVLDVSQSLIFRMRTRLYQFLCTSLSYDHRWQEAGTAVSKTLACIQVRYKMHIPDSHTSPSHRPMLQKSSTRRIS
ncbi:hypothetical protein KCU87_g468, partial [Aureobasidium melanogenum]